MDARVVAAVFVGGCTGGLARWEVTSCWPTPSGSFPWTVLAINCSGALLLGALMVTLRAGVPRRLLGTGFLGAWTTFSAIVVEADQLIAHGHALLGGAYVVVSAVGGLLGAAGGCALARAVRGR